MSDDMIVLMARLLKASTTWDGVATKILRGVMVLTFYTFGIQKWNAFTAQMLVSLISHSPIVFWLEPAFGVRGAGYFLGTSELTFGSLLLLGFWNPYVGVLGALGSIVTFVGTCTIIPFLPGAWAAEGGGFPIMTLPLAFLFKDLLFLAVSAYLLERDIKSIAAKMRSRHHEIDTMPQITN